MNTYRSSSSRDFSSHMRAISFSNATKERDDDLELFDYMRKREKELLQISDELGRNKISSSPIYKVPTSKPMQRGGYEDFLTADDDRHDYDWLLTPPGTPRFCSLGTKAKAAGFSERENLVVLPLPPSRTSKLPNLRIEPSSKTVRGGSNSRQITPSYGINGLTNTTQKPSVTTPKSATSSRSSTPSSRSIMYASKQSYGNDGLRNTATWKTSVTTPKSTASSGSSTPSSRSIVSASKSSCGINGLTSIATRKPSVTTPKSAASSRSSTPSSRSILPAPKPSPRPSMQSSRPPCPSSTPKLSQKNSAPPPRSSSVSKASIMSSRNSVMSQGTSLTVKTRPLQLSLIPVFSLETPPNLRTTMPEKEASANRGRPGARSSVQCTTEAPTVNRPRRQSRSPNRTRGRVSYDSHNGGDRFSLQTRKLHSNGIRSVTMPVVLGSKMVEKGIDSRRSVSQGKVKQATTQCVSANSQPKETVKSFSSQENTGFGRTLSKPALDMALKHMDITQSTPGNCRSHMPIMSNSSLHSVQAGAIKSKRSSIYDSPIATSSNESSEYGASIAPDPEWSAFDDNDFCERGSQCNKTQFQRNGRSTNWLNSPEYGEKYDQSLFSDQEIDILSDPVDNAARVYTGSEYYKSKIGNKY